MTTNFEIVQPIEFIVDIEKVVLSANNAAGNLKTVFGKIVTFVVALFILLLLPLLIIVTNIVFYLLSRKISNIKKQSEAAINNSTFNEVRELHTLLNILIELTGILISNKKKYLLLSKPLVSMRNDALYINSLCESKFLYSKEDMNMTDEDFKSYQESLSAFGDIWDYEDTEDDFKQIFNQKRTVA